MSALLNPPDSGRIRLIKSPLPGEPEPPWADAPRYAADIPFPTYRFVPGSSPHPIRDEDGHSYGRDEPAPVRIDANNWQNSTPYLYGVDLYHQGYLWEAHESWEGLWKVAEEDSLESNFLHALILNAAAQLKVHQCNPAGVRAHSQAARWRLARIRSRGFDGPDMRFFGLDVADVIRQLKRHYQPVWDSSGRETVRLKGDAPRLVLEV